MVSGFFVGALTGFLTAAGFLTSFLIVAGFVLGLVGFFFSGLVGFRWGFR